jgi:hypothetical protein
MIECVIVLALLSLLIATDPEPGASVLPHPPSRMSFTGKSSTDQMKD